MLKRLIKEKGGASLIEVLVSIVILGLVIVPLGSSFVLSVRLNTRSRELMQEQLAVSNAVEQLMASGIWADKDAEDETFYSYNIPAEVGDAVQIDLEAEGDPDAPDYFHVTVAAHVGSGETPFALETTVRAVPKPAPEEEGDGG